MHCNVCTVKKQIASFNSMRWSLLCLENDHKPLGLVCDVQPNLVAPHENAWWLGEDRERKKSSKNMNTAFKNNNNDNKHIKKMHETKPPALT